MKENSDFKYIKRLCKKFDPDIFNKLSKPTIDIFISYSYLSLFQKYGNQELARQILIHTGEIYSYSYKEQIYTIYLKDCKDNLSPYESLKRIGITTVKVLDIEDIQQYRDDFKTTMREFPEYKRDPNNPDLDYSQNTLVYVLGGFGAFGNPASFHNEFVRKLRLKVKKSILPLFKTIIRNIPNKELKENTKLEMLTDRMYR